MRMHVYLLLTCMVFVPLFAHNDTTQQNTIKMFLRKSIQKEHRLTTIKASAYTGLSMLFAGGALISAYILTDALHYQDKNLFTYGIGSEKLTIQQNSSTPNKNARLLFACSGSFLMTLIGSYLFMKRAKKTIQKTLDESPHLLTTVNKNS